MDVIAPWHGGHEDIAQEVDAGGEGLERVIRKRYGMSIRGLVSLPGKKRREMLGRGLTKPGWLWVIEEAVEDHMLPGMEMMRCVDGNAVIKHEGWEVYYGTNAFRVNVQCIGWLATHQEARWWIRKMSVFAGPEEVKGEREGLKGMLGKLLEFRELEDVVIELMRVKDMDEGKVERIVQEEVEPVAGVISERISGEIEVGEQEGLWEKGEGYPRIRRWFDGRWVKGSRCRGDRVRKGGEERTASPEPGRTRSCWSQRQGSSTARVFQRVFKSRAMSTSEGCMFEHLVEHQLVVCKKCRHAVWPDQIAGHLQGKQHGLKRQRATETAREIEGWPGVIRYPSELQVPTTVEEPFCQLPLYPDGFRCILEPASCHFIGRGKESIRRHWRRAHGWAVLGKKGGSGPIRRRIVEQREGAAAERVQCQRFFTVTHGSQYFAVCPSDRSDQDRVQPVTTDKAARWAEIRKKVEKRMTEIQQRAQDTIQKGEKTEVNPWLKRAGWQDVDVDQREREEVSPEAIDAQIWKAMDGMIRFSQESVTKRIGVFVRMEAIRTEMHQTRFEPLQAYMDEHAFAKHTRPWKQIVMFFARTQREHDWESPKYRFTKRQRQTWDVLVETARQKASGEESDVESDEDSEIDTDDKEKERGEADEEDKPRKLTSIQAACLDFCIQLLNQRITRKEYDSALVCALAVLGVKEGGWKGPEQYPPILSAVIKVARFMVVQKALQISQPFAGEEFEDDSGYDSGDSPPPPGRGCLQFVQEMMDHFMVRGSHSPMQWMLDLRTYGLKIHYNTTSPGHVGWKGRDELLYKEMNFTMGQFRGMIHGLRAECRRLLCEDLLFGGMQGDGVPAIPI
ncbi:hypothetical protein LTS18_010261 [Coniosporium uncinatum]|uniref:Uncharacterized protein n=1 Tax=Coniosporium uncinatum TaxID=93489 RepID=A0ACC3DCM7_9PEZI|nr:hypothetical protein LTS18_010261 [Coniosporium uncinatum]